MGRCTSSLPVEFHCTFTRKKRHGSSGRSGVQRSTPAHLGWLCSTIAGERGTLSISLPTRQQCNSTVQLVGSMCPVGARINSVKKKRFCLGSCSGNGLELSAGSRFDFGAVSDEFESRNEAWNVIPVEILTSIDIQRQKRMRRFSVYLQEFFGTATSSAGACRNYRILR